MRRGGGHGQTDRLTQTDRQGERERERGGGGGGEEREERQTDRQTVTNGISFHARVGRFSPFLYSRNVAIAVILFCLHLVVLVSPCFLCPRIFS